MSSSPFLRHPSAGALERFADRAPRDATDADRLERARTADHLAECARCRETVAFRRQLEVTIAALPTPEAPAAVIARVLAERARGERAILPSGEEEAVRVDTPTGTLRRVGPMAAAAALLLAVASARVTGTRRASERAAAAAGGADGGAVERDAWFVSTGLLAGVAGAQTPPPPATLPPAVRAVDGTRLRPRRLVYAARTVDGAGQMQDAGRGVITIDSARLDGAAAWRVDQRWDGDRGDRGDHAERVEVETLYVARADLRPLHRRVHVAPYLRYRFIDVTQRFAADSVTGRMQADGLDGRRVTRPIAQSLPAGPAYVTDALAPLFTLALSVGPSWSGSVTSVGWAVVPGDVRYAVALRVVGAERVIVPAGAFDCWRLVVTAPGRRLDYWVRRSDGLAVLAQDAAPRDVAGRPVSRRVELASDEPR